MGYQDIRYEVVDHVATVTLYRPQRRNGYTVRMADELAAAFGTADADDDVRAVILTGHGNDFCVGADLSGGGLDVVDDTEDGLAGSSIDTEDPLAGSSIDTEDPLAGSSIGNAEPYHEPAGRASMAIYAMNKPVIAALRGAAVGAGSTIILPADFRLASTDTRFGYVFTRRGLVPEGASAWFLPRLVGLGRALDWMVSGRVFNAQEALAAGLVTRLHEPDEVLPAAQALAAELVRNVSPVSMAITRQLLFRMSPLDSPFPTRDLDSRLIADSAKNADTVEGIVSFLEKRPPAFPGRVTTDLPDYLPWREGS